MTNGKPTQTVRSQTVRSQTVRSAIAARTLRTGMLAMLSMVLIPHAGFAGDPDVAFDLPQAIGCREVGPEELTKYDEQNIGVQDTGKRIVEATFLLSLRVRSGSPKAVEQIGVEIVTNDAGLRVVDFSPKTQLETDIVGEIERTTTNEQSATLGALVGGGAAVPLGAVIASVSPSVNAEMSKRDVTTESAKRLPPLETTVVSGTTDRGRGVFFQLRRSSQSTLEGVHELTVRFAVPADWRIARARIACRATGHERILWIEQETTWSKATLPVILYADGDVEAKMVALVEAKRD